MKAICLNLTKRKDRWQQAKNEFKKQEINVSRFAAIEDENAALSFNLSQQEILRSINENTIVFEDDVLFVNDGFKEALNNAPADWDILYFGGNVADDLHQVNKHWWRCTGTHTTHAIAYTPNAAKYILQRFKPYSHLVYDDFLKRKIQPVLNCYICKPFVCVQRKSYSDLLNKTVDYDLLSTEERLK